MPIYMKVEGISGSVAARPYTDWIQLESCQFGRPQAFPAARGASPSREASAASVNEVFVAKYMDNSSPGLFTLAVGGERRRVIIAFVQSPTDVEPYMRIELENTIISSLTTSGSGGGDRPTESLSLNFTTMAQVIKDPGLPGVRRGNRPP